MRSSPVQIQPSHDHSFWPYVAMLVCVFVLLIATSGQGIGFSSNSFSYLSSAESLRAEGLFSRDYSLVVYPPLLAIILLILGTNAATALWFNVFLLLINLALMAYIMGVLRLKEWVIVGVILAFGVSPIIILLHGIIQTEALFFAWVQLTILLLARDEVGRAFALAAFAPLLHDLGIVLIILSFVVVLRRYDFVRAFVFAALATLPSLIWMMRNYIAFQIPGREIAFQTITLQDVLDGVMNVGPWFAPPLAVFVIGLLFNRTVPRLPVLIKLMLLFCALYCVGLLILVSFFDNFGALDFRNLSPVILLSWIMAGWYFNESYFPKVLVYGLSALIVIYVVAGVGYSVIDLRPKGIGLIRATRSIHYDVLASIPPGEIIYTNHVWLVQMLGYQATYLPYTHNPDSLAALARFDEQMNEVTNQVYEGEAVILWFEEFEKTNLVSLDELKAFIPYQEYEGLFLFSSDTVQTRS